MPLDPTVSAQIDALVADILAKRQAYSDAIDANDTAQSAAQAAIATAAGTLQAQESDHASYDSAIDTLVAFLNTLK